MTTPNEDWWSIARQARDQLAAQILNHPNVSMIDIGEDPDGVIRTPVLRVHVRSADVSGPHIPRDIDGIPVRVIRGDYRLENQRTSQ
jgi:hypothetical protein